MTTKYSLKLFDFMNISILISRSLMIFVSGGALIFVSALILFDHKSFIYLTILWFGVLYLSMIVHELSHALTARTQNIQVEFIVLDWIGAATQMNSEPDHMDKFSRIWIYLSGPASNLLLSISFYLLDQINFTGNYYIRFFYDCGYQLNLLLGISNLIPLIGLDGYHLLYTLVSFLIKEDTSFIIVTIFSLMLYAALLIYCVVISEIVFLIALLLHIPFVIRLFR